ncbi:MAG: hypothetical protein E7112_04895 [Bacteroidales bacterium]|nr:hypothetical protein [Bacteroidales bacterium]
MVRPQTSVTEQKSSVAKVEENSHMICPAFQMRQSTMSKPMLLTRGGESNSSINTFITKYTDETIYLSLNGTSNCYQIAPLSATYSFDCTVKGNSTESVGSISVLEVLWETDSYMRKAELGTILSSISLVNHQAIFMLSDDLNEGNALIAAKDANGMILWSWHIWVTDTPVDHIYADGKSSFVVQDRHLGATRGDQGVGEEWKESCGIDYQWGRKDPFSSGNFTSTSDVYTIDQSIQNPTVLAHWTREPDLWSPNQKTMYDPCPQGYRVAPREAYACLQYTEEMSENGECFIYDGVNTAWYPFRGLPQEGGGINYWGDSYLWDSSRVNRSVRYASNYISLNNIVSSGSTSATCPLRCIKDKNSVDGSFSISQAKSLSDMGTANSYIVSNAGTYSILPVKGNSDESVGDVVSAELLWETYGTDEYVFKGSLISGLKYYNGQIYFKTANTYKEGNAVIAAKDASGEILWSWHIWLTDQPEGHVYNNNAGTMMDRNLGATSATPGDVGALGLLYQWGRKDPFLGSSSISSKVETQSTITWPSAVSSDSSTGTVDYVTSHPTTFVKSSSSTDYDWHYSSSDNTLWQSEKTIYDPCPLGWRVPDGGDNGVWATAKGSSSSYSRSYDSTNRGMNFSGDFGSASTIWYPASGYRDRGDGALNYVSNYGYYWSVTPSSKDAYYLHFYYGGLVYPTISYSRADGFSVRCLQESE